MNLTPFVESLTILDKKVQLNQFKPNWAQRQYLQSVHDQFQNNGRVRLIVLKARQLGISTLTEACAFSMGFIIPNYRSLIVAHEADASRNLLQMTKRYWNYSPWHDHYTIKHDTRNDMEWVETGSSMKIATAGKKGDAGVGRSSTVHLLHASEVGFWDDAEIVMLGLQQAIPPTPGTFVCLESTANGTGNYFHRMWEEAEARENEYVPLFFPWYLHPEYTAEFYNLPIYPIAHLDDNERDLVKLVGDSELVKSRIIWRRWAIKNLCSGNELQFMQEYPATAEEAFIASGLNVFPHESLKDCFDRKPGVPGYLFRNGDDVTFKPDPHGPLKLFKKPSPTGSYIIGGDPTRTTRGDYACAQILNRHTMEQVGIWRGKTSPGTFAEELYKLGMFFNQAILVPEIEGPGHMTVGQLIGMNYPNVFRRKKVDRTTHPNVPTFGWSTTAQNKELAIGWLLQHITNRELDIHDHHTFMEMRDYVTVDRGGYGPADEKHGHDDTVMAMAIAVTAHHLSAPPPMNTSTIPDIIQKMNNPTGPEADPYALA
jgi:hypothetical protein